MSEELTGLYHLLIFFIFLHIGLVICTIQNSQQSIQHLLNSLYKLESSLIYHTTIRNISFGQLNARLMQNTAIRNFIPLLNNHPKWHIAIISHIIHRIYIIKDYKPPITRHYYTYSSCTTCFSTILPLC